MSAQKRAGVMDQNLPTPPEPSRTIELALATESARWRTHLYVTLRCWRRRRLRAPGADRATAQEFLPAARRHPPDAPEPARRLSDGPWDDTGRARRPVRSCLIMATLLLVAWLTADALARLLGGVAFERLLTGG